MLLKRKLLQLVLLVALATSVFAQQQAASDSAPSVERLRAHVSYLASDKLEGRRTGTTGERAAAEYIAKEFSRYGLRRSNGVDRPGMSILEANSPRRYFQEFPFVAGVTLGRNNAMLFTPPVALAATQGASSVTTATERAASLDLRLGEDWTPLGLSANAKLVSAPAVFVGFGIKAAEFNYDDYAGMDVKGRVAIALMGTQDGDNPHGRFNRYADVRWKAIAAREQGAAALVVISREENFRDERLAHLSYDNTAGDARLPVVVISRQAAARILGLNGVAPLAELEKEVSQRSTVRGANQSASVDAATTVKMDSLKSVRLNLTTDLVRQDTPGTNVIGIIEGTDPQLKNEAIVIGAHYDHLGRGGDGSGSLAPREGEIHHGADDNASGVAGMLELARIYAAPERRPRRTLLFIAFGGEEAGLIGSNFYVNHPLVPLAQTVAMINMDMIGRMNGNRLMISGVGTAQEWREWINKINSVVGAQPADGTDSSATTAQPFTLSLNEDGFGPSDHASFYAKQIPVLFFNTGAHPDYHKPSDTAEKINYEAEARLLALIKGIIDSINASDKRPTYTTARSEGSRRTTSFRVTLGVVPNYAESTDGMKIDGVRDDSPAAKAGLKAGDKIVKIAGRVVKNVYDYTAALGEMKADTEYEIEILRGTETLKLKIIPTARK